MKCRHIWSASVVTLRNPRYLVWVLTNARMSCTSTIRRNNMQLDNLDTRIPYYHLELERELTDDMPSYPLPDGYHFVFYAPGDETCWVQIERSAKEFDNDARGFEIWNTYFKPIEGSLPTHQIFIETEDGTKVATASTFSYHPEKDAPGVGWVQWVAVRRDYQGQGLARPLISRILQIMRDLGYKIAKIPTQTTSWVACKLYMDFGFKPTAQSAQESEKGWRILKTLTNHPILKGFEAADPNEILKTDAEDKA